MEKERRRMKGSDDGDGMGYDTKSGGGEVEWKVRSYWEGWVFE